MSAAPTESDPAPRPAKRQRTSENDPDAPSYEKDISFWFEDGNIVLVSAQGTGFRVHLGILSLNAEFFCDMSGLALPDRGEGGFTLLHVTDSTRDLSHFLHAFYTRAYFYTGKPTHYDALDSMLRMSTKYLAQKLRSDLIKHLIMIYPPEMAKVRMHQHLIDPDQKCHSLYAIAMAREHDIPDILPTAFYFASTISPATLIQIHSDASDLVLITSAREKIINAAYRDAWGWLFQGRSTSIMCFRKRLCQGRRLNVIHRIALYPEQVPSLFLQDMPHQAERARQDSSDSESESEDEYGDENDRVCSTCLGEWRASEESGYKRMWLNLPSYFKLPGWEALLKNSQ
ncbi:uncharacterized protein ARMOST_18740 [Armillaria ostoyae]|uniref:BTB domain-containing protein n=1 Tax=Armillaria ostoyae TaxID=47428 RepID=A0A284S2K6_ARMOS|nr:uncharacterized protein ARMOST_18740 [Armillaria ostoyae]